MLASASVFVPFVAYLVVVFHCIGLVFGNLSALAMEPLGHIARVGAAVVGSVSVFIAVPLGALVGRGFDGTMYAQIAAFGVFGAGTLAAPCGGPRAARAQGAVERMCSSSSSPARGDQAFGSPGRWTGPPRSGMIPEMGSTPSRPAARDRKLDEDVFGVETAGRSCYGGA